MKTKTILGFVLSIGLYLTSPQAHAQGALLPTAAPAPTMKTLDQIYTEVSKLSSPSPLALGSVVSSNQQGAIHILVTGQKTGLFKGETTIKGLENSILCIAYSHSIVSPRDPVSGLPTGQRQHKPFVITKYVDATTPLFYTSLCNNENLTTVTMKFFQLDSKGQPYPVLQIKLTNANIASIDARSGLIEEIAFTYQRIEWTHLPSGVTGMDDWATQI